MSGVNRVKYRDVFKRLAEDVYEDPILLLLATIGVTRALAEVILIPAISDLAHKIMDRTVEPWENKFFDT